METSSVMLQSLCVPCDNHCRYCLLSSCGHTEGAPWDKSVSLARRYLRELKEQRPALSSSFVFGYSMEHPKLRQALQTLRDLGSPMADFLQCDGMRLRGEEECEALIKLFQEERVRELNFTLYGLREYHDRFAGRRGDFDFLFRLMKKAREAKLPFTAGIPLTRENISQAENLINEIREAGVSRVRLFIPHEEGRGKALSAVRLRFGDLLFLSSDARALLNKKIYKPEADWLKEENAVRENKRAILLSIRQDNLEELQKETALSAVARAEALDDQYYAAFPSFGELAERYGDHNGDQLYRYRDLFAHYRALYLREHPICVYDVTDERQTGSRRYEG